MLQVKESLVICAIASNDASLLKILHAKFDLLACSRKLHNLAAIFGSLETLQYLEDLGHPGLDEYILALAAKNGHLKIEQHIHAKEMVAGSLDPWSGATKYEGPDNREWLLENYKDTYSGFAMDYAARGGHLKIVQWLHKNGYGCSDYVMDFAIENCHLDVVEWLHLHRREGCRKAVIKSSLRGQKHKSMRMVEWLCVNRCDVNLHIDRFGVPWTRSHTRLAVSLGRLTVLRWMHNANPNLFDTLDPMDLKAPVERGNLTFLKWLFDDVGLEFTNELLDCAAAARQHTVLAWLVQTNRFDKCTVDKRLQTVKPPRIMCQYRAR
ncbi:hypothetical protein Ae201684P_019666 [Aphanomyces euteiches]|uniref:Uncharacterized protein n=1 Tax=Aphanomyces euteiches TaxID=100861 RepID=A0A6G0XEM3_9STRA|nr:hypothetical protein Ae201684_005585 [Aphanomyces euteiches]KAH9078586.1 hypothetical protein Ae201684P_019666 [Aphanomyces euteiches]